MSVGGLRAGLLSGLIAATGSALLGAAASPAEPVRPGPLSPRQVIVEPDRDSCRPEAIERGFRQQMLPWADQPEAVQARLRQLQAELTVGSLMRCVAKGLLTEQQARVLAAILQLPASAQPAPAAGEASGSSARP